MSLSPMTSSESDRGYMSPPYGDIVAENKMPKFGQGWVPESIAALRFRRQSDGQKVPLFTGDVHLTESQVCRIQSLFDSNGRMIDSASETEGSNSNRSNAEREEGTASSHEPQSPLIQWQSLNWDDFDVPVSRAVPEEGRTPSPVSLDDLLDRES